MMKLFGEQHFCLIKRRGSLELKNERTARKLPGRLCELNIIKIYNDFLSLEPL